MILRSILFPLVKFLLCWFVTFLAVIILFNQNYFPECPYRSHYYLEFSSYNSSVFFLILVTLIALLLPVWYSFRLVERRSLLTFCLVLFSWLPALYLELVEWMEHITEKWPNPVPFNCVRPITEFEALLSYLPFMVLLIHVGFCVGLASGYRKRKLESESAGIEQKG